MVLLIHGGFWESGGSVAEGRVVRIANRVNGLHPGGATLTSGRKLPSVFIITVLLLSSSTLLSFHIVKNLLL